MASLVTNRYKYFLLLIAHRAGTVPAAYRVKLITSAVAPTADTNTFSELTEIANGNGYTTSGTQLTPNSTDFDVITEDDTNDRSLIQLKDIVWTASGGTLPASGSGASYMVLTDNNVTAGSREVYVSWDLTSARSVSSGQSLTIQDAEIRLT